MTSLAIIPARGGSKRIPRKNIKNFLDKPIIAYSIEAAQKSGLFDEIIVSTDDKEIASIAINYGANVPFLRSEQNSNDTATTSDVIKEVLEKYEIDLKLKFDFVCCIYPTAPLISIKYLINGYEKLLNGAGGTVFPVIEFSYPIWRGLDIDENETSKFLWPEFNQTRSQDLVKVFHDAGQWYWMKTSNSNISLENSSPIIISELEAQDIDSENDWQLAELKYQLLNQRNNYNSE